MPEGYVFPPVSRLIDQYLMAQAELEADDRADWLAMSGRIQPYVHVPNDPADFEDEIEASLYSQ